MNSYHVVVLARAQNDLDSIFGWLIMRSPSGAERWLAAFENAKQKLREDPLRYSLAPERIRVSYQIRNILFKTRRGKTYRAIYTIIDDKVRILRIRRPAQRPIRGRDLPK